MRLLHCSDLHLHYLQGTRLLELCNKRITGAVNLVLGRAKAHNGDYFTGLLQKARELAVDRVLISGDLVNLGMRREFERCAKALAQSEIPLLLVPGNHDIYLSSGDALGEFEALFGAYLGQPLRPGQAFPWQTQLGELTLFGLNSSLGRPWFFADGELGDAQCQALDEGLGRAKAKGRLCAVMLHHPVTDKASRPRRDLRDRTRLQELLVRHRIDLVLHGHEHRELEDVLVHEDGHQVTVHGVASATATALTPTRMAAFTLYEIKDGRIGFQRFRCDTSGPQAWAQQVPEHGLSYL